MTSSSPRFDDVSFRHCFVSSMWYHVMSTYFPRVTLRDVISTSSFSLSLFLSFFIYDVSFFMTCFHILIFLFLFSYTSHFSFFLLMTSSHIIVFLFLFSFIIHFLFFPSDDVFLRHRFPFLFSFYFHFSFLISSLHVIIFHFLLSSTSHFSPFFFLFFPL